MRVAVLRPRPEADRTARRLAERGHAALVAPVLEVRPTEDPPPGGAFDALVLTSAAAVPRLATLAERLMRLPVYAVGRRSAETAEAAGFRAIAAGGDARDLARLVRRDLHPGAALLHAAGRDRKEEPAVSLRAAGYAVTTWESYAAEPVARLPPALAAGLRDGTLDAALHYSRRSAAVAAGLATEAGLAAPFAALLHAALSADVAEELAAWDVRHIAMAERPDEEALLAALERVAGPVSPPSPSRC